jgi:hypothetical protein
LFFSYADAYCSAFLLWFHINKYARKTKSFLNVGNFLKKI